MKNASKVKKIYRNFIITGIIVGILVGLRILFNPCDDYGCLINIFFPIPAGGTAALFTILALFVAWKYANREKVIPMYLAELGITIVLSIVVSAAFRSNVDWLTLLQASVQYVFGKLWLVYLLVVVLSALAVFLIRTKKVRTRFTLFLAVFLISGIAHAVPFTYITSNNYQVLLHREAVSTDNIDICLEKMPSVRDPCYWDIAQSRKDSNICNLVESAGDRESCLVNIAKKTNNIELCGQASYLFSSECYKHFAIRTQNEQLCYSIIPHPKPETAEYVLQRCINETRETIRILSTIPK